jgi:hypothetical protein
MQEKEREKILISEEKDEPSARKPEVSLGRADAVI